MVALVVAAFVAGRVSSTQSGTPDGGTLDSASAVSELRGADERVRLAAIGDHLEQSERVLLELLNADGVRIDVSG